MKLMHDTDSTTTHGGEAKRPTWIAYTSLAVAVAIVAVLAVAFIARDQEDVETRADPTQVIENYRIAYNSGDIERVMALFRDESVLTGHPLAATSVGLVAIRDVQIRDLAVAAPTDAYRMSNFDVSGDRVTWDHEFTNAEGVHWCAEGNSAVIADGNIEYWAFAADPHRC